MIRLLTRLLAAALLALAATSAIAQTPSLRPTILVAADIVRIGDLVSDVDPDKADIAIFRAPDLGETGTVRLAAVMEALRPHEIGTLEAQGLSEVSVTRVSRVVGADEIRERIAAIAAERLRIFDVASIKVTFDGPAPTLHLDPTETGPLVPARAIFDPRGRFEVLLRSADAQIRVTGTAQETTEAVVLTRAMGRGEVLRESDVALERRPKGEVQSDAVRDLATAVGMALQHTPRAGQVLRSADLTRPPLVKRSEPVMIVYDAPGISLTARGKAEENGSMGDTVNVLNVQSKRVIQGVVTGPGQITVTSLNPRFVAASDNRTRTAPTKAE